MTSKRYELMIEKRKDFLYARIEQLQIFLAGNDPVTLISVDGVQTQFDREGAREEIEKALAELGKLEGKRPPMMDLFIA